jgi:hypothetical protein
MPQGFYVPGRDKLKRNRPGRCFQARRRRGRGPRFVGQAPEHRCRPDGAPVPNNRIGEVGVTAPPGGLGRHRHGRDGRHAAWQRQGHGNATGRIEVKCVRTDGRGAGASRDHP